MLAEVIVALVSTMLVKLTLSIVALVAFSVVMVAEVELNCVMTPLEPVMEPEAEMLPEVEMFPTAVIAPEANRLLTALEPALNRARVALDETFKLVSEALP
jgi:hypothetical protein